MYINKFEFLLYYLRKRGVLKNVFLYETILTIRHDFRNFKRFCEQNKFALFQ